MNVLAADANVIVRYLVGDDPEQSARARRAIDADPILVLTTVLIEVAWVLQKTYQMPRLDMARTVQAFVSLPNVRLEEPDRVAEALAWTHQGMDFPDAVHLAGSHDCSALLSFDKKFSKLAARLRATAVQEP